MNLQNPLQDTKYPSLLTQILMVTVYFRASKLIKESEKHIYFKKLLRFLCIVYSMVRG
jgi:hypothetical protein